MIRSYQHLKIVCSLSTHVRAPKHTKELTNLGLVVLMVLYDTSPTRFE